ncbi:helix-turn-helix domain-containing protein [Aureisphaera galaxeae]|uniref:helix-turn-helix domain-containing protein n=1 Tax=Aureisphaera galaxeae TaxID=1538023 RepID=UPI0023508C7C|nr:helix-turn-helix domain-containing protein [Aureisphaera galaxeae]MDC8003348.1 helix-turn-helix domain-containing protein [Aureisphaera galaxeae]
MDKLSITSIEKTTIPYVEANDTSTLEQVFSPKRFFLSIIAQLSLKLYYFHEARQEHYKKVNERLKRKLNPQPQHEEVDYTSLGISKEILEGVILKIHSFETQRMFLSQDVSLSSLAKELGTNSSYLSKIINHIKGKSFKNYVNDLRIEHAHQDLLENPQKRKYTIEAIAYDNGFKSAESFSKKFREKYDIYPSAFLKGLVA